MQMSKKFFALTLVLCFAFGVSINPIATMLTHRDPKAKANLFLLFETARGSWSGNGGNLITNIGERLVRNILGFDNVTANNATKWISLSNVGSPLASWTQLDTEVTANGFGRALGTVATWQNGTDYAYNVTKKFTATGTQQLQTAGLQWSGQASTDNNLFAAATFTQTTFETNDNLTITWVITWDAN